MHTSAFLFRNVYINVRIKHCFCRLLGASFVGSFHNYYWSGFPPELVNKCFKKQSLQSQWIGKIAYYAPWLLYWFMTQNLFVGNFKTNENDSPLTEEDIELLKKVHMSSDIAPLLVNEL